MNNSLSRISDTIGPAVDNSLGSTLNIAEPAIRKESATMVSWAIEYSHSQQSFHIGRTNEMLRRNIDSVRDGEDLDYICVGIFKTREQAEDAILEFRRNRGAWQTLSLL